MRWKINKLYGEKGIKRKRAMTECETKKQGGFGNL